MRMSPPIGLTQLCAVPSQAILYAAVVPEFFFTKYAAGLNECNQLADKPQQISLSLDILPVEPAQLIILAVGIVIAVLRAANFISHQDHRRTLGDQQDGEKILKLLHPQTLNRWIIGGSFITTIPAEIMIAPILIVLTVQFVVLGIKGHQVVQ